MSTQETSTQDRSPSRETVAIGVIAGAAGLYFILVSRGVLPLPGKLAPGAPIWIVFAVGLVFLLAGLSVAVRGWTGTPDHQTDLAPGSPLWAHLIQHLAGIAIAVSFASIGTWIAVGGGPRQFGLSMPFFHTQSAGETIGRIAFGSGALIVWTYTAALIVRAVRKVREAIAGRATSR